MAEPILSRRALLGGALAGAAAVGLAACSSPSSGSSPTSVPPTSSPARPVRRLVPGDRPDPDAAVGTDRIPQIETIIIVMMENHTYDNVLGMQRGRGDGFTLDAHGRPTAANPWTSAAALPPPGSTDSVLRAFPMPTPCQQDGHPFNTWKAFHDSYDDGRMDGFADSQSGPVSMGYHAPDVLPFVNSLSATFPVCDRYFSSVGAQTYPNRRFLMAGTSLGLLGDTFPSAAPPNGTVFQIGADSNTAIYTPPSTPTGTDVSGKLSLLKHGSSSAPGAARRRPSRPQVHAW